MRDANETGRTVTDIQGATFNAAPKEGHISKGNWLGSSKSVSAIGWHIKLYYTFKHNAGVKHLSREILQERKTGEQ